MFFRYDYMFPFHFLAPLHSVILEVLSTGSTGRPVPIFRYSWGVLWQYARSRFANQPINSSRTTSNTSPLNPAHLPGVTPSGLAVAVCLSNELVSAAHFSALKSTHQFLWYWCRRSKRREPRHLHPSVSTEEAKQDPHHEPGAIIVPTESTIGA